LYNVNAVKNKNLCTLYPNPEGWRFYGMINKEFRKIYFQAYDDKSGKIIKVAFNADDILRDVDPATSGRAGACTADLTRFTMDVAMTEHIVRCAGSGNSWESRIQMMDFNYIIPEEERVELDPFISFDQLKQQYPDLMQSDLLVACRCPSYQFQFHYLLNELGVAMGPPEVNLPPDIRNPDRIGTVCKHLAAVLQRFYR